MEKRRNGEGKNTQFNEHEMKLVFFRMSILA
jgi:hypothetical protein